MYVRIPFRTMCPCAVLNQNPDSVKIVEFTQNEWK